MSHYRFRQTNQHGKYARMGYRNDYLYRTHMRTQKLIGEAALILLLWATVVCEIHVCLFRCRRLIQRESLGYQ